MEREREREGHRQSVCMCAVVVVVLCVRSSDSHAPSQLRRPCPDHRMR